MARTLALGTLLAFAALIAPAIIAHQPEAQSATCKPSGTGICTACKNCKNCAHCSKGGTCSVCKK